ncbi:MAG: DUF1080 domain-containing protein [Anaerolineales bacterium]|nr:DUF1080 domain-containing protein [Anaerolineales bacterium]
MKTPIVKLTTLILFLALLLGACNLPSQETAAPSQDPGIQYTQAAQTVVAELTQQAIPPTPQVVQETPAEPAQPTATSEAVQPSDTPQPSATPEPSPTATPTACTDAAKFVLDVTFADNTSVTPGQEFVKIWRLENTGTCTWTTEYDLVFVDGNIMGGPTTQPLPSEVLPGATVDISVALTAPGTPGTYQGDWMLRNAKDVNFGLGDEGVKPFYVKIKVETADGELDLGEPDWRDTFDTASNWYLFETENTRMEIADGHMIMTAFNAGESEEWGLSYKPAMKDYYIEATFKIGDTCSGLDHYGLLVRAPEPNKGYVIGFSCDMLWRIYKWDGETWNTMQNWTYSDYVKPGPGSTNVMGIWLEGQTIRIYANGKLLAEFTDDMFDEGRFGLLVGSSNTDDLVIYVEEVAYWLLGE